MTRIPVILTFSGHDPSGGAGTTADTEAINQLGGHCCPVVTAITAQNTQGVTTVQAVDPVLIQQQAQSIFEDMPVDAIKIGLIATLDTALMIAEICKQHPTIPVILDPVFRSGGNGNALTQNTVDALMKQLVPYATLITPNLDELYTLAPQAKDPETAANTLLSAGCQAVLVTSRLHDTATNSLTHTLYQAHGAVTDFSCPILPGKYHGSGCTLAASIAISYAQTHDLVIAIHRAQSYTWTSLQNAISLSQGQRLPRRIRSLQ